MTCARTRPFLEQLLGQSFYIKEHTKPLFKSNEILTVQNLYTYHTYMEVYKILKHQSPTSIYSQYKISNRTYLGHNLNLILPQATNNFMYNSTKLWNTLRQPMQITDLSSNALNTKKLLKSLLFENQHKHHDTEWLPTYDFDYSKIHPKKTKSQESS